MRTRRWDAAYVGGLLSVLVLVLAVYELAAWGSSAAAAEIGSPQSERPGTPGPTAATQPASGVRPHSKDRPRSIRDFAETRHGRRPGVRPAKDGPPSTRPAGAHDPGPHNEVKYEADKIPEVSEERLAELAAKARASTQPSGPVGRPGPRPDARTSATREDTKTDQPDLKIPGWWKLPPEERPYFFSWENTRFDKVCADLQEMSGLSMIGLNLIEPNTVKPITFQSVKIMRYDEALTTFDLIVVEMGFWVVNRDDYLVIRRLTEWYRHTPPERMYRSLEAYREADLPMWEVASVVYVPQNASASMLAASANDDVPDSTARATVVAGTNGVRIQGFVYFIERQLAYMQGIDVVPDDGREWKFYSLKHVSCGDASVLLQTMMAAVGGGQGPSPAPARPPRAPGGRRPSPTPTPSVSPVSVGASPADAIEIEEQMGSNRLLIKATPAKHRLIEGYLKTYIDVETEPTQKTEIIQLKHADPATMVNMINPILGERRIVQPPAPPAKPGKKAPPPPPPRVQNVNTTAVLTPLPQMRSILVKANDREMKQIKELIDMLDVPEEESKFQFVKLEHAQASSVATILTTALSSGRSPRPTAGRQPFRAVADTQTNRALVISGEPDDLEEAHELIAKLDVDPMAGAAEHMVTLENTVPSALSSLLSERFSARGGGGGSSYSYSRSYSRYGSRSGGGGGTDLPRFIANDESKMLIVLCHDEMWPDIERLILTIDEKSEVLRTTRSYQLKHTGASNVAIILTQALGSGGGRSRYYGPPTSPDEPTFQYDTQTNLLLVTATEEDHKKAADLIAQLDVPGPDEAPDFKPIQLTTAEAEYVAGKIQELFGQQSGYGGYRYSSRYGAGPPKVQARVVAEPITNRVLVSASEEDFAKAEELARAIDEGYAAKDYVRKTFVLEHAEPFNIQQAVQAMFVEGSGSSRSRYAPTAGTPGGVKIAPIANGIVVVAPKDKMQEIEEFIAELDTDPMGDNEIKMYKVEGTDYYGTYQIARNLDQLFNAGSSGGYRGGSRPGSGLRFIGEYGSDLLFVSAPAEKMTEIDEKVQEFLQGRKSEDLTMVIRHFEIKEAKPQDVADVIEPILQTKYQELQQKSGGRSRFYGYYGSQGPQVTVHKTARKIMVSAPEALMTQTEELIKEFDQPPMPSTTVIVALKTARASDIAPIVEDQMRERGSSSPSRSRWSRYRYGGYFGGSYGGYGSSSAGADELQITAVESSNSIILRGPEEKVYDAKELIVKLDSDARPDGPMINVYQIQHADLYDVASMIEDMAGGGGGGLRSSGLTRGGGGQVIVNTDYYTNRIIVSAPYEKFPLIEQIIKLSEQMAEEVEAQTQLAGGKRGQEIQRDKFGVTKLYDVKGPAKEIAEYLDKILYSTIGYDAPLVKPFFIGNQIVVTGDPKYFKQVEDWLEKIEKDPPPVQMKVVVRRTAVSPSKVVSQWARFSPQASQEVNIRAVERSGAGGDPMEAIKEHEIEWYHPVATESSGGSGASPFVPPGGLSELRQAALALVWTDAPRITVTGAASQPAATSQPASETAAKPPAVLAEAPPSSKVAAESPEPAAVPKSAMPAAASPRDETVPSAEPGMTPERAMMAQVYDAARDVTETEKAQILFDEDQGLIIMVGPESQLDEIGELMDLIIDELEEIEDATKADIRVFRVNHIDVTVAAAILEQMFNEQAKAKGKPGQKPPAKEAKAGKKAKPGEEEEEESAAARRRREEEEEKAKQEAEAAQAAVAAQRIKVMPDPRTRTLIVKAAPALFPEIAELLLKIDRPGIGMPVDIKIFKLQHLNAYEVEQAIKAILKIEDPLRGRRARLPAARGAAASSARQAEMIEQLQQQVLEMQAAAGGAEGEKEGTLKINPAKEITITSDATTNTIIVSAPVEGMKLVEKLINELEEQEIPIQIKTWDLKNADAEKVAAELEKVFQAAGRRGRSGGEGEGVTPSRIGNVKIAADSRTNKIVIRALDSDIAKIEPIIADLDVPPTERQVQLYPIEHASATELVTALNDIFVQDPKAVGTGPQAVRITADADTNTVLVRAPQAQQTIIGAKIGELDERVGVTKLPRQIELKFASATAVAQQLQSIFVPKGARGSRAMRQRVSVTGDDNSRILFVKAPDELFEEIRSVAETMDVPTNQEIRVFKLAHASATDVKDNFVTMATQLMRQLKGPAGGAADIPVVTADPRMNALIVAGSPAALLVVEQVIQEIDRAPEGPTQTTTAMFSMPLGNSSTAALTINNLYRSVKYVSGVQPPRAVASGPNVLYVYGTNEQIQQVKSQVIDPMSEYLTPLATAVKDVQIDIEHANVDDVAQTLTDWFSKRAANLQKAGVTNVPPAELAVSIMPDPATKRLFVSCTEGNEKIIRDLLSTLDVEGATDRGQQTKVIAVKFADLNYTTQALTKTFRKTGRVAPSEQVTITPEYGTNSIVIKAPAEEMKEIEALLAQIDRDDANKMTAPVTVEVKNVRATELARTLNEMIRRTTRRDRRTGAYPLTVTAQDAANALLVTAASAKHMEDIRGVIAKLDTRPAGDERRVSPYPLRYAELDSTQRIILSRFKGQEDLPLRDQVEIEFDYATGSLLVTASEQNHMEVASIVEGVDVSNLTKVQMPKTIKLEHARASDVAGMMNEIIRRSKRIDKKTRTYPITVTANDASNTLVVMANEENMAEAESLIAQLDVAPKREEDRSVKSYPLQYAEIGSVVQAITTRFQDNASRPVKDQVGITPDYTNNALLVTASDENHAVIDKIITDLDTSNLAALQVPEKIKVDHIRASELADMLNEMIRRTRRIDKRTRTYPVTVSAHDPTNTLMVTANARDMEEMKALITQFDVPREVEDERTTKSYFIQYADVRSVLNIIDTKFADNSSLSLNDQVEAVGEYATNSVVVTASATNHEQVSALIEQVDQTSIGTRKTFTIAIQNADPEDVAQALTTIYNTAMPRSRTGRVPAVFTVARGSRMILATCSQAELEDIKALVNQLDVIEEGDARDMRVVAVQRIAPREMSQILTEYLRKPGRAGRSDPSLLGDVKIMSSDSASAVVLTGPEDRLNDLEQLIRKVDDEAPDPTDPETGRKMEVIALTNADPSSVATVITRSFTKRGAVAEADRVDAVAERATNSVVVTATEDKLKQIREMVANLDKTSANTPQQKIIRLEHARAEDLADVLTQTYRSSRRGSYGPPITFAADPNGNAVVVSAGLADLEGIEATVAELDKPATEGFEELRVIPLEHIDAQETLDIMTEYLRKPGGRRSRTGSDLIGDIRLQASGTLNALIVSGSKEELDRIEKDALHMDKEVAGAGVPKIIKIEHASASQLATTLTRIFTDPAKSGRGRRNTEMIPLIMANEATNSLVVRARVNDFTLIEDMARQLDTEATGLAGVDIIAVQRGVDVTSLARQLEQTINRGESYLQRTQPGYLARQVAIGVDPRSSALIVAGPPEMFERVRQTVTELQTIKPPGGGQTAMVIPVKNIRAQDVARVLDQFIEQQQGGRR